MGLFFRYLNLVCKMLSTENMVKNTLARKTSLKSVQCYTKVPSACNVWNVRQKGPPQKKKKRKNAQTDKNSKVNQRNLAQMLIRIHHYTIKVNPTCNTGINDSVSPLLPSPLRSISPAAPDGLVWWLLSRETWPGPSALVYLSGSLLPGQSGHFLVALVTQRQNKGGSR